MLKLCITFDYELFLGENYCSAEEILFKPSEKLARMLQSEGISGTYFADVCSVEAHEKFGLKEYPARFRQQLTWLTEQKQDVQLHLHTNWLKSELENNQIRLTSKGYRLHESGFDPEASESAYGIMQRGIHLLQTECRKANPEYQCIAYRAGGFAIQPEEQLIKALLDNGIVIDSSVVPHIRSDSVNAYDFTGVPNLLNWWIDPHVGLGVDSGKSDRAVFEVPLLTSRPGWKYFAGPTESRYLPKEDLKGSYVKPLQGEKHTEEKRKSWLFQKAAQIFEFQYPSLDGRPYQSVFENIKMVYRKYRLDEKDAYVCLICHPKLATDCRIQNIKNLIETIYASNLKIKFYSMQDIYREKFICKE